MPRPKMRRNRRTMLVARESLSPLTERILSQMGQEGAAIRERLKVFYREGTLNPPPAPEEIKEKTGLRKGAP